MRSISIVTSCRNAAKRLRETADSVFGQHAVIAGRVSLQYVIIDAASTDDTLQELEGLARRGAIVVSEADQGLYDGLCKGFRLATGDVLGYLNAGDVLHPAAFDALLGAFDHHHVQWVTGVTSVSAETGPVVRICAPWKFRQRAILGGLHNGKDLPFIQQESTFWRRTLMERVDLNRLAGFRLAGDAYLWSCFAQTCELHSLHAVLGEFRWHPGQLSSDREAYFREMREACPASSWWRWPLTCFDRCMWTLDQGWKLRLDRKCLRYDRTLGTWGHP